MHFLCIHDTAADNQVTLEQQKERREQHIQRLKEINAKRRLEKLQENEEQLQQLMSIQLLLEEEDEDALKKYGRALKNMGFRSSEDLQVAINKLTINIQRTKAKILGKELPEEPEAKAESKFDLLHIPDEMLTAEQQAAKKKQHILKSAHEGRARAHALQRAKRQKEMAEEMVMEEKRLTDFESWLHEVRQKRKELQESRAIRRQRRADMAKRRTLASQQRMRIISQLAQNTKKHKDDNFGQNDADWDVYKAINTEGGDTDSEAEEEQLEELEAMLRDYDPEFQKELEENAGIGEFDIAEYYRLHLGVERIRVPELLFQPSMIGNEQAGLAETVDYVLKKCSPEDQNALVQCVFLTGSNAMFPNFNKRMERELLEIRPFQSTFSVYRAADPILDSWYGARQWALSPLEAIKEEVYVAPAPKDTSRGASPLLLDQFRRFNLRVFIRERAAFLPQSSSRLRSPLMSLNIKDVTVNKPVENCSKEMTEGRSSSRTTEKFA
ncbi:ACTR5 [Acanthosepion pharaonis]|uniref:ACTR5 n=1 Tax=Acanthosepion pharaonis TaxID=158019 RepID=A0A812DUR5_ACAPH|nr:ACTR5 [Sepia pharaonis]